MQWANDNRCLRQDNWIIDHIKTATNFTSRLISEGQKYSVHQNTEKNNYGLTFLPQGEYMTVKSVRPQPRNHSPFILVCQFKTVTTEWPDWGQSSFSNHNIESQNATSSTNHFSSYHGHNPVQVHLIIKLQWVKRFYMYQRSLCSYSAHTMQVCTCRCVSPSQGSLPTMNHPFSTIRQTLATYKYNTYSQKNYNNTPLVRNTCCSACMTV